MEWNLKTVVYREKEVLPELIRLNKYKLNELVFIFIIYQFLILGVNLRTGRIGIFPSAYAVDCDYTDWDSTCEHGRRERYLLGYLGSVETLAHKGTSVVCQAVRRVVGISGSEPDPQPCILEVSDQGLRMVDRRKRNVCKGKTMQPPKLIVFCYSKAHLA